MEQWFNIVCMCVSACVITQTLASCYTKRLDYDKANPDTHASKWSGYPSPLWSHDPNLQKADIFMNLSSPGWCALCSVELQLTTCERKKYFWDFLLAEEYFYTCFGLGFPVWSQPKCQKGKWETLRFFTNRQALTFCLFFLFCFFTCC